MTGQFFEDFYKIWTLKYRSLNMIQLAECQTAHSLEIICLKNRRKNPQLMSMLKNEAAGPWQIFFNTFLK